MRFLHPEFAAWGAAVLVCGALIRAVLRRRRSAPATVPWVYARAYRPSLVRRLPAALLLATIGLLLAALADPVVPYAQIEVRSRGLDIVLAIDLSSSMEIALPAGRAAGAARTRLEATRRAIQSLIDRRDGDRIGLVVFSEHGYVISPLTFDHAYLRDYVEFMDDQLLRGEGLTAIGEGIAAGNNLLTRMASPERRDAVMVVFTDGENNSGRDPVDVLAQSHAAGIRVHMIGIALDAEVRRKPDVRRVVAAVRRFGGLYFDAGTGRELDAASAAIDQTEKQEIVSRRYERESPVFQWFAVPALVCLALAFGIAALPPFIDLT